MSAYSGPDPRSHGTIHRDLLVWARVSKPRLWLAQLGAWLINRAAIPADYSPLGKHSIIIEFRQLKP